MATIAESSVEAIPNTALVIEMNPSGAHEKYIQLGTAKSHPNVTFAWRNIVLEVPIFTEGLFMGIGAKDTGKKKAILKSVSGYVEPGDVVFLMGPSGAGKSTLLDALADRTKAAVGGVQWLNGEQKSSSKLKEVSKYVQQEEALLGALTVAETLHCAAACYVKEVDHRAPLIEAVIELLGLQNQTNTKVGDMFFRGLSGGQKRRLSVGIELISQPSMLFLDEPTSGLDAASAFQIMTSLRHIAKATKTPLIITIHQPSERLFQLGDSLLLLSGGQQAYFGPISEIRNHFQEVGFEMPTNISTSDWLLDRVNRDFGDEVAVDEVLASWKTSRAKRTLDAKLIDLGVPMEPLSHAEAGDVLPYHYRTDQITTTLALFKRGFVNATRSPVVIWFRFAMYLMLSLMIGTIWLQLGNSAKVINDVNGALFFTTAFMIFMSISVLPGYLEERNVYIRERGNGSYSVASYLISHFLFELPFLFLLSFCCSATVYWLVGFRSDGSSFFIFVCNLFFGLLVAESIMVLISACIPFFIVGIAVGAFLFGAFMCVMGYFIAFSQIGWWWKWMRYIAVHYYNFSTFMTNQYWDNTYTQYCPDATSFPCYQSDVAGSSIVTYYELENRIWVNFIVQLAMVIIYRCIAGVFLHYRVTGKR